MSPDQHDFDGTGMASSIQADHIDAAGETLRVPRDAVHSRLQATGDDFGDLVARKVIDPDSRLTGGLESELQAELPVKRVGMDGIQPELDRQRVILQARHAPAVNPLRLTA